MHGIIYRWSAALALLPILGFSDFSFGTQQRVTVLANVAVIDVMTGAIQKDHHIIVAGNTIRSVVEVLPPSVNGEDVRYIDLSGKYAIPGLWNNHSHLGDLLPDPKNILQNEPLLRAAIRGGRNAMDALRAGFTSLRMVGDRDYIDVAWKEAFEAGVFVGPRIYPSGAPISDSASGDWLTEPVSGELEMREMVRSRVENGAQLIKLIADRLTREELAAAIAEARSLGVPVVAHAGGDQAALAVQLGVNSIEHGNSLSHETINLMAKQGTFLDPTIVCNLSEEYIDEREKLIAESGYAPHVDVKAGRVMVSLADKRTPEQAQTARTTLTHAVRSGVKIISGSDSNPIDELGILEIEQLVFSGLTPLDALRAATINSAEMMQVNASLGSIESGKLADIVILQSNPVENISNLRSTVKVMKDGLFVVREVSEGTSSFWDLYFLDSE